MLTAQTAEAWAKPPKATPNFDIEVAAKQAEFRTVPSVPVASELMFLAAQAGNHDAARIAAQVIVQSAPMIGSTRLVEMAKRVLSAPDAYTVEAPAIDFVRQARRVLAIDFRNPVLLMDVARELTARSQERSALKYVRSALALAPNSRFIVRAATRFYLHIGEHEIAHDILKRSRLLQYDSWVQASEIAVATVRGKNSTLSKSVIRSVSNLKEVAPHLSELVSAIATVELQSGSNKSAKRLFQLALAHPNDNSLAQAEWAANRLKLVVDEVALRTPLSFEANSNNAYRRLLMPEAISFAEQWAKDEPFASRPFDSLCFLFSLEGRYKEARDAAERAIAVDGDDNLPLQMNLLFAHVQNGEVDTAYADLIRLTRHQDAKKHAPHMLANAGALAYATGDIALGRDFYERAVLAARKSGDSHTEALARAFFARAATQHADQNVQAIVAEAAQSVERLPNPGAIHVMRALVDESKRKALELTASTRVAKRRWEWDAATNTLRELG